MPAKLEAVCFFTALLLSCRPLHGQGTLNLVSNGSFERISVIDSRAVPWLGDHSFTGGYSNAPNGTYFANIGSAFQDVVTAASAEYSLSFWAAPDFLVNDSVAIIVRWGGLEVYTASTAPQTFDPSRDRYEQVTWQRFQTPSLIASGGLTRLEFIAPGNSLMLLDDVRLHLVPEPALTALFVIGLTAFVAVRSRPAA